MKKLTLLFVSLLALSVPSFAGLITLDDFSVNQATAALSVVGNTSTGPLAIGGGVNRSLYVEVTSRTSGTGDASVVAGDSLGSDLGIYTLQTGSGTNGLGKIIWTGAFDLNDPFALQSFQFNYTNDLGFNYLLEVFEVDPNTPTGSIGGSISGNVPFVGTKIIPLGAWSSGVNFSNLSKIVLTVDPPQSGDVTLGDFSINQVPEPGTYALMGAGLLALAALRRKK